MKSMPLGLAGFIGWRFSRSRRGQGFLSFISASSTIGIALGCFVLILVLSVMNGFERELKERLLSVVPHAELIGANQVKITDWQQQVTSLEESPHILVASPVIKISALLQKGKQLKALEVRGVDPELELKVSGIGEFVDKLEWQSLNDGNSIILGKEIMKQMGLKEGDSINLMIPQLSADNLMKMPKTRRFNVVGGFAIGGQLDFGLGYISLKQAQKVTGLGDAVQGIRLKVDDVFAASAIVRQVGMKFPYHVYLHSWMITQGHLYNDIKLVRTVMYLVLTLVIAVASFNIVSTLVMTVHDKRREIAILKTMGASSATIIKSFVFQGAINGILGTLIGSVLAIITAINLPNWYLSLEKLLNTQFLQNDVYFINFLPTELHSQDVLVTVVLALLLSVCSTIYPAIKASAIKPAEVLGH